ncbi:hypothetical protein, partial [Corynebacterium canis]|uniref:hypothetical protein n=1 Tax=Corynebacterium canis TaxID=679663 RepID=UPI0031EC587A
RSKRPVRIYRRDLYRHLEPSFLIPMTITGKLPKVHIFNGKVRIRDSGVKNFMRSTQPIPLAAEHPIRHDMHAVSRPSTPTIGKPPQLCDKSIATEALPNSRSRLQQNLDGLTLGDTQSKRFIRHQDNSDAHINFELFKRSVIAAILRP